MASKIDPSVPVVGEPTTASVRTNFLHARDEINALDTVTAKIGASFTMNNVQARRDVCEYLAQFHPRYEQVAFIRLKNTGPTNLEFIGGSAMEVAFGTSWAAPQQFQAGVWYRQNPYLLGQNGVVDFFNRGTNEPSSWDPRPWGRAGGGWIASDNSGTLVTMPIPPWPGSAPENYIVTIVTLPGNNIWWGSGTTGEWGDFMNGKRLIIPGWHREADWNVTPAISWREAHDTPSHHGALSNNFIVEVWTRG